MENYQNHDIDREQMEHDIHNLPTPDQMKTFDEMIGFLKTRANCRVDCVHFFVLNLHSHLAKIQLMVESIPMEKRKTHFECEQIKHRLSIILKNYLDGNIQPTGTLNVDTTFSTYKK